MPNERELYAALLTRWWDSRQAGRPHPMVDRRNDQRLVLNRLARQLRHQMGELGDTELAAAGGRRFAVGDEVIARMGTRDLHPTGRPDAYVRNGAHGTITAIHPDPTDADSERMTVEFTGLGTIEIPRSFFDEHTDDWGRVDVGIDHAYAVTSYAVEGLTYDESSSHVDPQSTRPEVYVDITRGREANHVYLTAAADPLDGERLPAVPADEDRQQFADRLARSRTEVPAIELDPLADDAARYAQTRTLAQLHNEHRTTTAEADRALAGHAARIKERQIARRATVRPDPFLTAQLVARPDDVFLAARYDRLLADMAIYRARWEASPARGGDWVFALGRPPTYPDATQQRRQLVERLERLAVATVARHLPAHTGPLPDAARDAIRHLAATGTIGRIDPATLVHTINTHTEAGSGDIDPDEVRRRVFATASSQHRPVASTGMEEAGVS